MGNENERKHDPAENRQNQMGHKFDDVKSGGGEQNVGQTGGSAGGQSVGSGGAIGGSERFTTGEQTQQEQAGYGSQGGPAGSNDPAIGSEDRSGQVLTGEQAGADIFSGQPQSGTSTLAANNSRADLGASGAGSPGSAKTDDSREPRVAPGGRSEIGGASDLGGGETDQGDGAGFIGSDSQGDRSGDYLQRDGNPQAGFAEEGQGAPASSGPEGSNDRTANASSDVEGSSRS